MLRHTNKNLELDVVHIPVILALERERQEDVELEALLGYIPFLG